MKRLAVLFLSAIVLSAGTSIPPKMPASLTAWHGTREMSELPNPPHVLLAYTDGSPADPKPPNCWPAWTCGCPGLFCPPAN